MQARLAVKSATTMNGTLKVFLGQSSTSESFDAVTSFHTHREGTAPMLLLRTLLTLET